MIHKCPKCGSTDTEAGFGLAGGGYGVYWYCKDCNTIFDKVQDPTEENVISDDDP